jgi:hypothetical protein
LALEEGDGTWRLQLFRGPGAASKAALPYGSTGQDGFTAGLRRLPGLITASCAELTVNLSAAAGGQQEGLGLDRGTGRPSPSDRRPGAGNHSALLFGGPGAAARTTCTWNAPAGLRRALESKRLAGSFSTRRHWSAERGGRAAAGSSRRRAASAGQRPRAFASKGWRPGGQPVNGKSQLKFQAATEELKKTVIFFKVSASRRPREARAGRDAETCIFISDFAPVTFIGVRAPVR